MGDPEIAGMIDETGLCVPLAARFFTVSKEMGASQMEIITAMEILKTLLDQSKVPVFARGVGTRLMNPLAEEE
jgi:hypothetical protein